MKNYIEHCLHIIKVNGKVLTLFAAIYSLCSFGLYDILTRFSISLAMRASDITYLADNTLLKFFSNPLTWLIIIVLAIFLTSLNVLLIGGISFACKSAYFNKKVSLYQMACAAINGGIKFIKQGSIVVVIYLLCLSPFIDTIEITSTSIKIGLPGFILDAIWSNKIFTIALLLVITIIVIVCCNLAVSLPIFINEDCNFKQASKKSYELMKGQRLKLLFYDIGLYLIYTLVYVFIGLILYLIFDGLYASTNLKLFNIIKIVMLIVIVIIYLIIEKIFSILSLNAFYYKLVGEKGIVITNSENKENNYRGILVVVIIICLALGFMSFLWKTDLMFAHGSDAIPEICAHRGSSTRAPENSLPAFKLAVDENISSWVELDVHQTKDGVIIVSHDDYLGKIGIDRYVHDSTYEELIKYDSGKWFSKEFEGLHLCTLKEALELMKNKVCVQIEIKPTEYDDHIEEAVLAIIEEVNSSLPNAILSLSDKPLKRIKEIDPEAITIYCTIVASQGIEDIEFADWFSIEESSISEDLVKDIKAKGKKVFVWTINDPDSVQNLVDCGVDLILTDDPVMLKDALNECDFTTGVSNIVETLISNVLDKLYLIFS